MSRPRLFVLDEPSMGLAPLIVVEIFQALTALNRDERLSILVAEQNSAVALKYADRATVLENGISVIEGRPPNCAGATISKTSTSAAPPLHRNVSTRRPQHDHPIQAPVRSARAVPPVAAPAGQGACDQDRHRGDRCRRHARRRIRRGCLRRDRERIWPKDELDAFSQSGLWSINVPKAYGGPEFSYVTLAKVITIISAADPSHRPDSAEPSGRRRRHPHRFGRGAEKAAVRRGSVAARALATPSPSSAPSARRTSRPSSPTPATMSSSTARNSIRPARCWRIWCRSWLSMTRAAPGTPSPTAARPA